MWMKSVDDFRLRLGNQELVPIVIGGMGVDISTAELALEAARLGGIGHISDAMVNTVADRRFNAKFVKDKLRQYKFNVANSDKSMVRFDLGQLAEATGMHVGRTMEAKRGDGLIFVNCMEKLTMNAPRETLRVRMAAALDAGIDGITLAAGLHLGSFALIEDHPRFRDAKLGIIVSSLRALQLFLRKTARSKRLPDYVVVEGPLAGGHLGFGMDWAQVRSGDHLQRDSSLSASRAARYSADSGRRYLYRQRRRRLSRAGRCGRPGGDTVYRVQGVRPAGGCQAALFRSQRRSDRGQPDFPDRLPDAHVE
jgi:NAD(P)H-dependent flavin oxidoreductase YrpB (nitropropane dioxygenase family)